MQENQQKAEPILRSSGHALDVHSIFHTIQGEGPFSGRPSVFVRLAGCNLQCPGCDTDYTSARQFMQIEHILEKVLAVSYGSATSLVVITGGEPLRQNIVQLCVLLVKSGLDVQIESNGVFSISDDLELLLMTKRVHLVVSPKTSRISTSAGTLACAFKYVLRSEEVSDDGLPTRALMHKAAPAIARPPAGYKGTVYLNPMDEQDEGKNRENIRAVVASCQQFGYTLGLQIHKILEVA